MKIGIKCFSIIVSSLIISFASVAQDAIPAAGDAGVKKLGYGAKIGIGSSNFSKSQFKVGSQIGGQIGGFVGYKVMDMLTLQLEVLYMQQGGKEFSNTPSSADLSGLISSESSISRITLHNLEIPLLAKVKIPGLGKVFGVQPHVLVGPTLGYNLGATYFKTSELNFVSGNSVVITERGMVSPNNYATMQWGAYLGAGIETQLKSFLLSIDVRYRQGINPVNTYNDINTFVKGYGDGKSNTIALTVGLGF